MLEFFGLFTCFEIEIFLISWLFKGQKAEPSDFYFACSQTSNHAIHCASDSYFRQSRLFCISI